MKKLQPTFGHYPNGGGGGGGLNACQDGLGHFFREELCKFKWGFACFLGRLNPCQNCLGHLCSEILSSNGHLLLLRRVLRLARMLCGTYVLSKR